MDDRRALIALRWGDQDPYGHINHVAIVRIIEESRVRAMWEPSNGILPPLDPNEPIWALVSQVDVRYRAVLDYSSAPAEVELTVIKLGGGSFTIDYRITTQGGRRLHVEATTTIALVDHSGAMVRMSEEQRAYLRTWVRPTEPPASL